VHLDVKPANIIIKRDGTAVLVDFGFAHHARYPDLLAEETRFGAGSAPYISPEQILGRRDDPRSDVFALGVVLYELLTGRFPFGEPDTDVRNRLWFDPLPPCPDQPWLQEIVLRCIEPDPLLRYQSAAHVAFDLRHPEQVPLTNRAVKSSRAGVCGQLRRFLRARSNYSARLRHRAVRPSGFPIVMVAVDTMNLDDRRHPALQRVAAQILSLSAEFRVICISVVAADPGAESNVQLEHLIRLRHWTEPLRLPPQRLSLHVIASTNPAEALLEFARLNNVDLIVLGAPGPRDSRGWWRSVASTVTANAHCSVHVVRV
jgi:serine/threonine protein kinase